jgi:translation initiation factor IF-1
MSSSAPAKKNVGGGKGHKRAPRDKKSGKNFDFCQNYVDDIISGEDVAPLILARVERLTGQGRMEVLTVTGKNINAALKGTLRCKKGGARNGDNPIAVMVGGFVILMEEEYGNFIMGVLNRGNVAAIKDYFDAPPSYFEMTQQGGEGFEWDTGSDDAPAAGASGAAEAVEVNIDAL